VQLACSNALSLKCNFFSIVIGSDCRRLLSSFKTAVANASIKCALKQNKTQVFAQRPGAVYQILLAIAAVEVLGASIQKYTEPGDLKWDPLGIAPEVS
jgi:hypothetical protein